MKAFEFIMPNRISFGIGKFKETGTLVADLGKRGLIVCDDWSVSTGLPAELAEILSAAGIESAIYSGVIPNPTVEVIDAGAKIAVDKGCDFVIGLGGGSSMDTAKGIAVAVTHAGSIWPYAMGEKEITAATLPIAAISTTSGTGSQCTCFAVISNPETRQKPGVGSPHILPRRAIVDPELMLSAPPQLTINTGFDAFCHAVEAYTSTAASELSDLFAEKALKLVGRYLERCYRAGKDLEARTGMALADTCAGIAICNGVVTLPHVIAQIISAHFSDIPHGDALYSIYREALKFNSRALAEKHRFIANAIDPGNNDVVAAFENFFDRFEFRNLLRDKFRENPAVIASLARDTFTYMKGITELNPVAATEEDARKILSESLK
ncbi:MAG: iron-containing alcohol dehydrogenase [Victivallaceae bacterium]|nr:iron-containing alcohol dehydrogenase [Victivallaceae bacterium]